MKTLLLSASAMLAFAAPAAAQTVVITNAKLVIGDGSGPFEGGTVVIRDGRVVAAGTGVAAPAGARVIDAGGRWVTPGIFAGFTRMGIVEVDAVDGTNDTSGGTSPFNASLDVTPAVNPKSSPIAINRLEGVTRAVVAPDNSKGSIFAGQGAVIDLGADMDPVAKPRAFQFMEYGEAGARAAGGSRPAAYAMLKNALFEVRDYVRSPASFNDRGKDALLTRARRRGAGAGGAGPRAVARPCRACFGHPVDARAQARGAHAGWCWSASPRAGPSRARSPRPTCP
jgi:hypothetical protein